MIVLDRLLEIKKRHHKVLQDLMLEITRTLSAPNLDIKQKTLDIALDLVSPKNIEQLILVLKKEISKTQSNEEETAIEYRQMLINAIHKCAIKYPEIAPNVTNLLIEFIGDSNSKTASDVAYFLRDVMQKYPSLREQLLNKLIDSFSYISSSSVFRVVIWILGEYSDSPKQIEASLSVLFHHLGETPFAIQPPPSSDNPSSSNPSSSPTPSSSNSLSSTPPKSEQMSKQVILQDGTYQTTSALMQQEKKKSEEENNQEYNVSVTSINKLRDLILKGHFFLGNLIAQTMTKMVLKSSFHSLEEIVFNGMRAKVMLYIVSICQFGISQNIDPLSTNNASHLREISLDSYNRFSLCLKVFFYLIIILINF